MMRKGMGCIGLFLFSGIFFLAGAGVSWWGWNILQDSRRSESWPTTDGQITYSGVRESRDDDGTTYYADVEFAYVVDDRRYTADTVSFGQYGSSNRRHAAGIVAQYPVGQEVAVYYDPAVPETAVLEPGVTWSSYMVLGIGLLFVCSSFIMLPLSLLSRWRL